MAAMPDPLAPSPLPSFEEVDEVRELVVAMGGNARLDRHQDRYVVFGFSQGPGRFVQRRVELVGCGHRARIDVPDPDAGPQRTLLCVICDCAQLMPRLAA